MQNIKFNMGFKGRCRWERGYCTRRRDGPFKLFQDPNVYTLSELECRRHSIQLSIPFFPSKNIDT